MNKAGPFVRAGLFICAGLLHPCVELLLQFLNLDAGCNI